MLLVDHIRVGFVNADSRYWPVDTKYVGKARGATNLAEYLWRASVNERLDLVLGITPEGASYLLLPRAWVRSWNERVGGPAFNPARSPRVTPYFSLSPIQFIGFDALEKRLKDYAQRGSKTGIMDTSKANQPYFMNSGERKAGEDDRGVARAEFENSRLLYSLCHSENSPWLPLSFQQPRADLTSLSSEAYEVHRRSARSHARVLALSFSTHTVDTAEDTCILDVGWCDVSIQSRAAANATNYMLLEQKMKLPGQRFRHDSVALDIQPSDVVRSKLEQILGLARPETPLILLVHAAKNTRELLEKLGIRTSSWETGIYSVLYEGGLRSRERSRSPRRDSTRRRSLSRTQAAVHVVDVELLVKCARGHALSPSSNNERVQNILEYAAKFNADVEGRKVEPRADPQTPNASKLTKIMYNAGHDSLLIAETWLALADGPDRDELNVQLVADDRIPPEATNSPSPEPNTQRERDDDDDPNIEPSATANSREPPRTSGTKGMTEYFEDLSDEEGDYC